MTARGGRRRWLWPLFGIATALVVAALVGVSGKMLELERKETAAVARARHEQALRVALRRLDDRVAQILEREARRPPDAYMPIHAVGRQTYNRNLEKLEREEILAESPLVSFEPDDVRLHFQLGADGTLSSPQVPEGVFLELCGLAHETVEANARVLRRVRGLLDPRGLDALLRTLERTRPREPTDPVQQRRWNVAEQAKRGQQIDAAGAVARDSRGGDAAGGHVGPLEPLWRDGELLFVRRARVDGAAYFQGFLLDWPRLEKALLADVADLFPDATLARADGRADHRLFTLPVALAAPFRPGPQPAWTASHTVLALVWGVVLGALVAAGYALSRSARFADRQRRFASLVTHELRSPLTTFRLYSDLLAEGLVRDEAKRTQYHRTLQADADRMARMVENVLAHARVEEGRAKLTPRRTLLPALLDRVRPELEACAGKAGLALGVDADGLGDVAVETDPAAVGQILSNLVDNACKYGRSDRQPAVRLSASVHGGALRLAVRDYGAGVEPDVARRIFHPFERGARGETDPVRGLGIGLALARGLARDLGGDLRLEHPRDGGACFVLSLPAAQS